MTAFSPDLTSESAWKSRNFARVLQVRSCHATTAPVLLPFFDRVRADGCADLANAM